jgi:hypothetical protein
MKRLFSVLAILCIFGLTTGSFVQSAPTTNEGSPVVQGTLLEIDGPFYVIMDSTGKEQRVHVDKRTMIIGKVQPGVQVEAEVVTKDGHASAVTIVGS